MNLLQAEREESRGGDLNPCKTFWEPRPGLHWLPSKATGSTTRNWLGMQKTACLSLLILLGEFWGHFKYF